VRCGKLLAAARKSAKSSGQEVGRRMEWTE
jgi:hypothetical protein